MAFDASQWMYNSGSYRINNSLRSNNADSPYLSKIFASAGNRKTWTFSAWVKKSRTGDNNLFSVHTSNSDVAEALFNVEDLFQFLDYASGYRIHLITTAKYRDPSAWYHIVIAVDTTQGTAANRAKLWINGIQPTLGTATYPNQNTDLKVNTAMEHRIASSTQHANTKWLAGYLAEVNFLDGVVGTAENFGEYGDYGEWIPRAYTGNFGDNGFYLSFEGGGVMSATGGNSTATDGDFKAASFTANGTFTPSADGYVEYLVIAGGGAGAADGNTTAGNGGGGAGGYKTGMLPVTGGTGYAITVGAGGVGTTGSSQVNGVNSVFSSITSTGGGGGGFFTSTPGAAGGSGGGGSAQTAAGGAANPAGQGNAGETASNGQGGGGGGGAGEAGGTDGTGQGGDGLASGITGSSVIRAGGGGGSIASGTARVGGTGGGGAGGSGGAGTSGTANTGSGGGAGVTGGTAGSGGKGIVILRYKFQ